MADVRLEQVIERLEATADRLRAEDLAPGDAAELVESCARLATEAAAEVERLVRGSEPAAGEDQLRMGGG